MKAVHVSAEEHTPNARLPRDSFFPPKSGKSSSLPASPYVHTHPGPTTDCPNRRTMVSPYAGARAHLQHESRVLKAQGEATVEVSSDMCFMTYSSPELRPSNDGRASPLRQNLGLVTGLSELVVHAEPPKRSVWWHHHLAGSVPASCRLLCLFALCSLSCWPAFALFACPPFPLLHPDC
jgi:hypothetical protein